jgi:exonuclease III
MKIVSLNVNGLSALTKETFFTDLEVLLPDILCMQEIKALENHVAETHEPTTCKLTRFKYAVKIQAQNPYVL